MTINNDDQRLTAYALDEMSEAERAEFEALLAEDKDASDAIADISAMADLLAEQFAVEDGPTLSDDQRAALEAEWLPEAADAEDSDAKVAPVASLADAKTAKEKKKGKLIKGPWLAAGSIMALAAAVTLVVNPGGEIPSHRLSNSEAAAAKAEKKADHSADDKTVAQGARPAAQVERAVEKSEEETPVTEGEAGDEVAAEATQPVKDKAPEPAEAAKADELDDGARDGDDASGAVAKPQLMPEAPNAVAPGTGTTPPIGGAAGAPAAAAPAKRGKPSKKSPPKAKNLIDRTAGGARVDLWGAPNADKKATKLEARPTGKKGGLATALDGAKTAAADEKKKEVDTPSDANFRGLATGEGAKMAWQVKRDLERRRPVRENPFKAVAAAPLSTFAADVDTASYSNVRQMIQRNLLPSPQQVRIEEMVNYFGYNYPPPSADGDHPFAAHVNVAQAPWNTKHRLVRIGIKGREISRKNRPSTNLVFLVDVSGSMSSANKLPLLQHGMRLVVDQLGPDDRVAIVKYAGESGVALKSTLVDGNGRRQIDKVINSLVANGSTNGSDGLRLAYEQAVLGFAKGGINRVVLASDGDFNVGITNRRQLERLITAKARSGVFLTVLGLGMGNFKDGMLEMLADKGNGNYAYLDNRKEVRKVLVDQLLGTLVTIAKDVKFQVEFNPAVASAYRLIGYENRKLAAKDFADDTKDAGEIGAGHTVTALYEVVPAGVSPEGIKLKYAQKTGGEQGSKELLTVKIRYKSPEGSKSVLMEQAVQDAGKRLTAADRDFQFAAAVAAFGMVLRNSAYVGNIGFDAVHEMAMPAVGPDPNGHRKEFLGLVKKARSLRR